MRVRAAKERRVQELRQSDVVDKPAAPAQQRLILDAREALAQERGRAQSAVLNGWGVA